MSGSLARGAVTSADVARYAGVSQAVVSYVLNGGPRPVAPATADRVRQAIEVLGYRPNNNARALRRGVSQAIGLVLPDSHNPFFAEIGLETQRQAAASGRAVLMGTTLGSRQQAAKAIENLLSHQIGGLLVRGEVAHHDALQGTRLNVPAVLLDTMAAVPGRRCVGADLRSGAAELVDHLVVTHGLSRIGLVIGDDLSGLVDPRELGWRDTLRRHGLPEGPIVHGTFDRHGGYQAMRALLADLPQAVFASNDLQAVGVLRALHEAGLRIPEDIAVVGFDGTAESEYSWPPLTVARQPVAAIVEAAFRLISEAGPEETYELIPTELVIRRSCGCPAPSATATSEGNHG